MKVTELGEFGLIDMLAGMLAEAQDSNLDYPPLLVGIGDDAAAWQGENRIQLATVDSLIENIHFSPDTTSWEELGWKSLAINLSDIAAMGGTPEYALVSLGLPDNTEVDNVSSLYRGMIELGKRYRVILAGGDTCSSPVVMITVTVFGTGQTNLLRRSNARPGDSIAVTGDLGGAAAGLEMLSRKINLSTEIAASLRESFNKPIPRLAEGQLLVKHDIKTAIDISDGFFADLRHICQMSRVSARVDIERLPVSPPVRQVFGEKALEMALSGGEDYELLFTGNTDDITRIQAESSCPITVVGEITGGNPGEISLFDSSGNPVQIRQSGWEHFRK